ncbi:uncharacterized protein UV8b_02288 [Ustilaginoidea virens]|nr:uncharacterized protein UV8b_02288 [Ustilaginoidea virens]QUC18047.1 hypothetical protein UV8b_02288 [Ustilaginoidea virens]
MGGALSNGRTHDIIFPYGPPGDVACFNNATSIKAIAAKGPVKGLIENQCHYINNNCRSVRHGQETGSYLDDPKFSCGDMANVKNHCKG